MVSYKLYGIVQTNSLFCPAHQHFLLIMVPSMGCTKPVVCFILPISTAQMSPKVTLVFPSIALDHFLHQVGESSFCTVTGYIIFLFSLAFVSMRGNGVCVDSPKIAPNVRKGIPHQTWSGLFRCSTHSKIAQCLRTIRSPHCCFVAVSRELELWWYWSPLHTNWPCSWICT